MNSVSISDYIGGIVRAAVTAGGGSLVTAGMISGEQLTALAGAAAVVVGVIWSVVQKKFFDKKLAG